MKTVLITGANRGIGLEFCKQYLQAGNKVIAVCRKSSTELNALDLSIIEKADLGQAEGIHKLAEKLGQTPIDLVVHNAGLLIQDQIANVEYENLESQFKINAIAPVMLSKAIQKNLISGSRLVFITSRMGSIEDNTSGGYYGYRMSKAALNIAARSLSLDLASKNIIVGLLHPGFVRTEMTGNQGTLSPSEAAKSLITQIEKLDQTSSGKFLHSNGSELPW